MTVRTIIAAVATVTSAAAASAGVWYALAPQGSAPAAPSGQSAPAPPPPPPAGSMTVAIVCVAPDGVLRKPLSAESCPQGHRLIKLDLEEECPLCPPDKKPEVASADPALRELEQRISALENTPYFEVVNNDDKPVFVVSRYGVRVFDKAGVPKAAFGTAMGGGYFSVTSGLADASITAAAKTGGVRFVEDGLTRLILSGNDVGGSSLRLPSGTGVVAGLGVSNDGPGTLLLGTLAGQVKSTLSIPGDRAMVTVQGDNGSAISLMEQRSGGGMLQIDSKAGAIVKMGNVENHHGIVMTGPTLGIALIPKSGLPGSFILGCGSYSPPACTPVVP